MGRISNRGQVSSHSPIAWRRAADELLIAAIFGGTVGGCHDDDLGDTLMTAPTPPATPDGESRPVAVGF